jgi:hypothetical protein
MTAMTTGDLKLNSTLRLLALFIVIAVLTGCYPGLGSFDSCPVEGCGTRTLVNLGGTLSGLDGSRLMLQNMPQNSSAGNPRFDGPSDNGVETFLAAIPFSSPILGRIHFRDSSAVVSRKWQP